jgi:signal transduction histidine kinase
VVVVQTQAARGELTDLHAAGAGEVERHLEAVESTAREALREMRRMLGLLQVDDLTADPHAPGLTASRQAPSQQLDQLVERARSTGLTIDAVLPSPDARVSVGLEMSVYRVVQEALTNVVKHAPGAHVRLSVRPEARSVVVEVLDDGGTHRPVQMPDHAGFGLIGMQERVAVYGGTLQAGPTPEGGFRLCATFPLSPDDESSRTTITTTPAQSLGSP